VAGCGEHTSEGTFYRRCRGLTASRRQTHHALVSATDGDDEVGRYGNTTSTLTCRRCHGHRCQHCCLAAAETQSSTALSMQHLWTFD